MIDLFYKLKPQLLKTKKPSSQQRDEDYTSRYHPNSSNNDALTRYGIAYIRYPALLTSGPRTRLLAFAFSLRTRGRTSESLDP